MFVAIFRNRGGCGLHRLCDESGGVAYSALEGLVAASIIGMINVRSWAPGRSSYVSTGSLQPSQLPAQCYWRKGNRCCFSARGRGDRLHCLDSAVAVWLDWPCA